jgi:uncharacterized membrane protein HdeD (DUF308 family)
MNQLMTEQGRHMMMATVPGRELRRARKVLIAIGILSLVAGAAAIAVPAVASVSVAVLLGWLLVFAGTLTLFGVVTHHGPDRAWRALDGVLALAAGVCILAFPLTGTLTLTFLLAVWFFASGVFLLMAWWQMRGMPGAGLMGLNGAVSLVLGALIAASLPSSAGWAIGLLVGINLIFWGVRALVAAGLLSSLVAGDRTNDATARPGHA